MQNCTMGVGCQETGVCYADAHGAPERCPLNEPAAANFSTCPCGTGVEPCPGPDGVPLCCKAIDVLRGGKP